MLQDNSSFPTSNSLVTDVTAYGHKLSDGFTIALASYFILLIIGSVLLNSLLIFVIIQNRILHSATNILFVNLAITDLITSFGVLPFDIDFLLQGFFRFSKYVCGVKESVFLLSLPASCLNLLLLTFERFVLIINPYWHRVMFTKQKTVAIIMLTWIYTIIISVYPIIYDSDAIVAFHGLCFIRFPHHYLIYELAANFSVPLLLIVAMNGIIIVVWSQRTSKNQQLDIPLDDRDRDSRVATLIVPSNFMSAKVIMIITAECLVCWLTFIVLTVWNYICVCHSRWLTWTGNAINFSAIVLNPILYGLLNTQIRSVLSDKCRLWRKQSKRGDDNEVLALNDESVNDY